MMNLWTSEEEYGVNHKKTPIFEHISNVFVGKIKNIVNINPNNCFNIRKNISNLHPYSLPRKHHIHATATVSSLMKFLLCLKVLCKNMNYRDNKDNRKSRKSICSTVQCKLIIVSASYPSCACLDYYNLWTLDFQVLCSAAVLYRINEMECCGDMFKV